MVVYALHTQLLACDMTSACNLKKRQPGEGLAHDIIAFSRLYWGNYQHDLRSSCRDEGCSQ